MHISPIFKIISVSAIAWMLASAAHAQAPAAATGCADLQA